MVHVLPGGVAQLGERLLCKQEVIGSIPFTSTIIFCSVAAAHSVCLARATRRGVPLGTRERYLNGGNERSNDEHHVVVAKATKRFGSYWFPALAGEEIFDIVNREYMRTDLSVVIFRNERT